MDCKKMLMKAGSMLNLHITVNPLTGTVKTIQCDKAVCELGFSVMNIIFTKIRTELFISSVSATMFVKFDITALTMYKATPYAESWLVYTCSTADPKLHMKTGEK
jgi:hypothetical protein